jgi:arylsulfatase A-like enzyme
MSCKNVIKISLSILSVLFFLSAHAQKKQKENSIRKQPNIIFILADDMGYGDVGVFFQNQRRKSNDRSKPYEIMPNLDKMAASGAMFTQQYCNAPVCAPSRASLLTGVNQGNAHVRDNQFDKALEDNHTLATVLKQAGYETIAIGKWGLQGVAETGPYWPAHPLKRGFDYYYGYIRHMDGHEHYPVEGIYRGKKEVYENYKKVAAGLDKCFTTDLWTAMAKKQIIDHEKSKDAAKPFFMYLAYDAPHAVLELPTQAYPKGQGLHGGMQWLGTPGHMINTASGMPDSYMNPEYAKATYDDDHNPNTPEVPWPETYKRYAMMNRRVDDGIGDILQLLKDLKIDGSTLVVFSSDNGASIESYLPKNFIPVKPTFFMSNGPFDGIKRDCWEGGVRMPVLAQWPKHIAPGKVIEMPSMLSDWLPTFADAAGISAPARSDGVSLLPVLTGKGKQEKSLVYVEYFESGHTPDFKEYVPEHRNRKRGQMQVIRFGDYAGVRYDIKSADDDFEIYNVIKDPQEAHNFALTKEFEKMQQEMKAKVLQVRRKDDEAKRPYDDAPVPASVIAKNILPGLQWNFYPGDFPWVPSDYHLKVSEKGICKTADGQQDNKNGMTEYEGYIKIPANGLYSFSLKTNGKAFIRLHEAHLFDADSGYKAGTEIVDSVILKAGYHPIKISYLNNHAPSKLLLKWKSENGDWKELKGEDFFHGELRNK